MDLHVAGAFGDEDERAAVGHRHGRGHVDDAVVCGRPGVGRFGGLRALDQADQGRVAELGRVIGPTLGLRRAREVGPDEAVRAPRLTRRSMQPISVSPTDGSRGRIAGP